MLPPEPARFSTMTCWPRSFDSQSAKIRAVISTAPPAGKAATKWIGRVGYFSAAMPGCEVNRAAAARTSIGNGAAYIDPSEAEEIRNLLLTLAPLVPRRYAPERPCAGRHSPLSAHPLEIWAKNAYSRLARAVPDDVGVCSATILRSLPYTCSGSMRSKALKCFERGSAMSFQRLMFAFALSITATGSIAQTIPFKTALSDAVVAAIPPSTTEDFYTKLRDERRRNAPRIVFVPGILGSKIEECQSDGTQCKEIWGTVKAVISKDIDLSIRPDRVYRTDVVDDLFFNDIYGISLSYLRSRASQASPDSADDPLVTVFPYDWRQSNARNAISLANKICQVRLKAPESPIVLIAHSMGGLMAKIWANRYSRADCSNGAKPSVSRFVFVATPHLGAPKTIKAIAQGYNILFDELDGLNRYKSWFARFERDYFLDSLNQAGMSFASLYELLPIRTSEYCRNAKPTLAKTLNPVDGEDGKPLNLFDPNAWRHYDLLRRIGAPAIRDVYYDNKLAPLLRNAEVLLCEIVDFDPSSVADVIYLFGREKTDRTYGW